jgi:hypothetical protein
MSPRLPRSFSRSIAALKAVKQFTHGCTRRSSSPSGCVRSEPTGSEVGPLGRACPHLVRTGEAILPNAARENQFGVSADSAVAASLLRQLAA